MTDIYVIDFGGDDDERARREAERDAGRRRLRARYAHHLVARAAVDEATAQRIVNLLFDLRDRQGRHCICGCHPRLSAEHGDGLDCRCTWDEAREAEQAKQWEALWDDEDPEESHEEDAISSWLAGQLDVVAGRTTSLAPEQWEGSVDGHSFYFRGRGGHWRIELDLRESGNFAQRLIRVAEDGRLITESVPLMEGEIIAEGFDSQLGATPVDHIAFIVQTIRDHLWQVQCDHAGALFYCPKCGHRMTTAN